MTEREYLARVISQAVGGYNQNASAITAVADAVLAAGYTRSPYLPRDVERALSSLARKDDGGGVQ